ncbi:MAG TPA: D-2-hydroxyacid dehydrogenase [Candidatus Eisenbacteria bacterium]|nr:D-2-hydroxyacid dehydrogenase [Candidatus Eisenbacteria bacterium]
MSDLVLITGRDPEGLARAASAAAGEAIPWVGEDDPRADSATVWFASSAPSHARKAMPALRWIHSAWAGVDRWLDRPEWREGVRLTRTVADFPERISEYVLGYLLAQELGVARAGRQQSEGRWERWVPGSLAGKTILVVGHGAIGRRLAGVARAFGMETLGVRRGPVTAEERAEGIDTAEALAAFLPRAAFVVNLLPLNAETEAFWNASRFALFAEGSVFVNVSRGRCVDDRALLEALERGRPARALLDVFREEPLPPESPYWAHPRVLVTPHVAGLGSAESEGRAFGENWRRWRAGEPLRHVVDRTRGY